MRILYLGINYWPDETGIAPFATGRCEYLAACGHNVTACVGPPYYPEWRIPNDYRKRSFAREMRNGVTILRSWTYVPRRLNSIKRILHEASFVCSSFARVQKAPRPDLLIVTSPPLALGAAAIILSRMWRVPYVLHVPDLQPDAAVDLGMLKDGSFIRMLYGLEAACYRNAAIVSTLNAAMRRRILAKGVAAEKVVLFPDWADPRLFSISAPGPSVGGEQKSHFVVAHFGNIGVKQGLETALYAAHISRHEKSIEYLLVGDGAARPGLEAKARELKLPNCRFLNIQPHESFLELLRNSDLSIVTQRRSVADIVFPSKIITLMAAARPIVASVGPQSEVARVIEESQAGITVPPDDPASLANAILGLRNQPGVTAQMGRAGRLYSSVHWERETVLKSTEQVLIGVPNNGRGLVRPIVKTRV